MIIDKKVFELPHYMTHGGALLKRVRVGWESYGTLDRDRSNAILVTHYFSATSHAAGRYASPSERQAIGMRSSCHPRQSQADHRDGCPAPFARGLCVPVLCQGGRSNILRGRSARPVPASSLVRRSYPSR